MLKLFFYLSRYVLLFLNQLLNIDW